MAVLVPKVEAVTNQLILGEGPHWDHNENVLYFVDLPGSTVHKYNPATNMHTQTPKLDGKNVTFVIPIRDKKDKFAIAIDRDLAIMTWNGENCPPPKIERILTIENEAAKSEHRVNDAKAAPTGTLWAGTMGRELGPGLYPPEAGALYSISKDRKIKTHVTKVGISNGLAWSKDQKYFYWADSHITEVFRFKFNAATGDICDRQSVFDYAKHCVQGFPDGMTIDEQDKLWVACFSAGEVIRVDPDTGKLLQRVSIPAPNVTSCAFGGPNLDELYVTTASIRMTPEEEKQFPSAGALFKVSGLGTKGLPGVAVDL